jgi:nucleotide-binding universal stress UspA family protein
MTILVPGDGSRASGMALKVHLLNVQGEWREGSALPVMAAGNATRAARALLSGARVDFESHVRIGAAAEGILRLAREQRCHKIVMGTRRLGTLAGLLLGSVARQVLRFAAVPVTLVGES